MVKNTEMNPDKQNYTNLPTNHSTFPYKYILLQLHGHPAADLHLSVKVLLAVPGIVLVSPAGTQLLHLFRADEVQGLGHHPLHALTVRRGSFWTDTNSMSRLSIQTIWCFC